MNSLIRLLTVVLGTLGAAAVGWIFVDIEISGWYAALAKPPFMPSGSVFALVWVVLYALMAIACAIIWLDSRPTDHHANWVRFYFIHLLPNVGWVIFFFGFHSIWLAFTDILVLGFFVVGLTVTAYEIDRRAAYLLLPYMAWILFAAYLNVGIWVLN